MDAICDAADAVGYPSRRMPSGAGHGAAYMSALGPMGMIFVPCLNDAVIAPRSGSTPHNWRLVRARDTRLIGLLDSKLAVAN